MITMEFQNLMLQTILKNDSVVANKCLKGDFRESIDTQLRDLKEFYKK